MGEYKFYSVEKKTPSGYYEQVKTFNNILDAINYVRNTQLKIDLHFCKENTFEDGQDEYLIIEIYPDAKVIFDRSDI